MATWSAFLILLLSALIAGLRAHAMGASLRCLSSDEVFSELIERHRSRLTLLIFLLAAIPALALPFLDSLTPFTPEKQASFTLFFLLDVALISFAVNIGDFPTRKIVFDDRRDVISYARFFLRLMLAFLGFWMILILAPIFIHQFGAGPLAWIVATSLCTILVLWSRYFRFVFCHLLEARPLEDSRLLERFNQIMQKSSAVRPQIFECGPWNGGWCNAVALPSTATPRIVMSHSLLDLLDTEEAAGIFAHELAHIEDFNPKTVRRMLLWETLMIFISCFLMPILISLDPAFGPWGFWAWLAFAVGVLVWRVKDMQHRETESDLRAVDLTGNAEAVISALKKIHDANRFPRRMAVGAERNSSHPSLARRIQDIQEHRRSSKTGATEASSSQKHGDDLSLFEGTSQVFRSREKPTEIMLMDDERITWLTFAKDQLPDLPSAASCSIEEVDLMRAQAATERSVTYGALTELRLVMKKKGGTVRAVERSNSLRPTLTRFPIKHADIRAIREALDRVDTHLAPLAAIKSATNNMVRIICFLTAVCSALASAEGIVTVGNSLWIVIISIPAVATARRSWIAALGAVALWTALAQTFHTWDKTWWSPAGGTALAFLLVSGAFLIHRSLFRSTKSKSPPLPNESPWNAPFFLTIAAALFLLVQLSGLRSGEICARLYSLGLNSSGSFLPLIGSAAALLCAKGIRAKILALLIGLAGLSHSWLGSQYFLENYCGDPFVFDVPAFEPEKLAYNESASAVLQGQHLSLNLSPEGTRFFTAPTAYQDSHSNQSIFRVSDWEGNASTISALDLHFLDEDRLLALVTADDDQVALQTRPAAAPGIVTWSRILPHLEPHNVVTLAGRGDKWRVTANQGEDFTIRFGGMVDSDLIETHTWAAQIPGNHWRYVGAGNRCLQILWEGPNRGAPGSRERIAWITRRYWKHNTLRWLTDDGREPAEHTLLSIDAREAAFGTSDLLLLLYGPTRGWAAKANTVSGRIQPLGSIQPHYRAAWDGRRLALLHRHHLLAVNSETGRSLTIPLPRKADWNTDLAIGESAAALSWPEGDSVHIVRLSLPSIR